KNNAAAAPDENNNVLHCTGIEWVVLVAFVRGQNSFLLNALIEGIPGPTLFLNVARIFQIGKTWRAKERGVLPFHTSYKMFTEPSICGVSDDRLKFQIPITSPHMSPGKNSF